MKKGKTLSPKTKEKMKQARLNYLKITQQK